MNETLKGQLIVYCECVKAGVKPLACIPIQIRYVDEAVKYIKDAGLIEYVEFLSDGWATLYIYKHLFMERIIECLPHEPKTVYDHWVLGKAFGYSDNEIANFIETRDSWFPEMEYVKKDCKQ